MIGTGRSGLLGLVIVVGVLYYTGAGKWVWSRVSELDVNCYTGLSRLSPSIADPVCGALAEGISFVGGALDGVGEQIAGLKQRIMGSGEMSNVNGLLDEMRSGVSSLASSGDMLTRIAQQGPSSLSMQPFQRAIDSFSIGSQFMNSSQGAAQALPWLQQGAAQPQGYGVMSQLALGNLFASGGQGVAANPQMAQAYLTQAQGSLSTLTGSNSPQAQQLLQSMSASPQEIQAQIQAALKQITAGK